jgi:hypothetical protein
MGVGGDALRASIQRWGVEGGSSTVKRLGHLHNNYIHDLYGQGLFGLGSFLSYMIGLIYVAVRLIKYQPAAALGISGIFFMHSSSSLTNVNFAHNYYPTTLSIAVACCFLLFIRRKNNIYS